MKTFNDHHSEGACKHSRDTIFSRIDILQPKKKNEKLEKKRRYNITRKSEKEKKILREYENEI